MKFLKHILVFLLGIIPLTASAIMWRPDTVASKHLRISLLTVGVGNEIYATFGHTGIRILDSSTGKDIVYNYGTFDGFQEGFEMKFMRGKLEYYISSEPFEHFIETYIQEQRKVEEQELFIPAAAKVSILHFLVENELGDNKYYKYDFLFDNCATRIRDVFPKALGLGFRYGQVSFPTGITTYRQMIHKYLAGLPWERLGINLLLGRRIDKAMTNEGIMFLPDFLRNGMTGATINGHPASSAPVTLLRANNGTEGLESPAMVNAMIWGPVPMLIFVLVLILTCVGLFVQTLGILSRIMSTTILVITGLLGCLIIFMWLGTDHLATKENWNILWCLPTNLLVPFIGKKGKDRYAIIALLLLAVALIFQIIHYQQFPLADVWPLWAALFVIFGTIYRRRSTTTPA